jgi:hypothetical protein
MKSRRITFFHFLYFLVLLIAISVRLVNLGAVPLNEGEADLALRAADVSDGKPADYGAQPAYTSLTGLTFDLLGDTNFTARLWPALMGTALVLIPLFFQRRLGQPAALIFALGLAIDPGLAEASRQASGTVLALGFTLLALGLAENGLAVWAGIAAGLALLSGPALLPGLLGLALVWGSARLLPRSNPSLIQENNPDQPEAAWWNRRSLRQFFLSTLLTLLLVGTLFLRAPQGISAWLDGLPAYISGWGLPSGVPAMRLLVALPVYQPLALLFGVWGIFSGWLRGDRTRQVLSLWFVFALLLALIYPARQMSDLIWALIPLWALAALTLSSNLSVAGAQPAISLAQAALIFFLMALGGLNLAALGGMNPDVPGYYTRFGLIGGVVALGAVTTSLVSLGWSWLSARQGLVWGLSTSLAVATLAGLLGATQVRMPGRVDLWQPVPASGDIDLLAQTVVDLSYWKTGEKNGIDMTLAVDSAALRWAFRKYPHLAIYPEGEQLHLSGSPSIVITRQDLEDPGLSASYRGQDFVYRTYPGWAGALPAEALRWLAFGLAPQQEEQVILWARVDLFPGGAAVSNGAPAASGSRGLDLP